MMMYDDFGGGHVLMMLLWMVIIVAPFWRISTKAGYSGWLSLLILIPLANVLFLYFLAFSNWPSQRRGSSLNDG